MYRNTVQNRNQHAYLSASLKYYLDNGFTLQARGYFNHFINDYERDIYATTQATLSRFNGNLHTSKTTNTTAYGDILLSGSKKLNNDWELNFTAGASIQQHDGKLLYVGGSPTVPNVFLESALDRATIDIRNFDEKQIALPESRCSLCWAQYKLTTRTNYTSTCPIGMTGLLHWPLHLPKKAAIIISQLVQL
ncbi:hypothetical protein [Paraflavitalea speifideaquila]|uniref:hypothetical protein n=1 Tax=Paraflavitalea speifideaquila TaxID=3076558 RepID=UPI0028E48EBA|nr:hypothetical protein [Paraflavitalea speifideiaquila]